MFDKSLPMAGFEPQISGVEGNSSTNWVTTTAQTKTIFSIQIRVTTAAV